MLKRIIARIFGNQLTKQNSLKTGFVPLKDENGKVTGMMNRTTAALLQSKLPNPSQHTLDAMLADVSRVSENR